MVQPSIQGVLYQDVRTYETMAKEIAHASALLHSPKIHDFKTKDGKKTRQELTEIVTQINAEIAKFGAISEGMQDVVVEVRNSLVQANWDIMNLDNEIEEKNRKKPSLWQRIKNLFFPKDRHISLVPLFTHGEFSKAIAKLGAKEKSKLPQKEMPAVSIAEPKSKPVPFQPTVGEIVPPKPEALRQREEELGIFCNKATDPKTSEDAKAMLEALQEFPGERDLSGMFCLVPETDGQFRLHYLDSIQEPKERLVLCQEDGTLIVRDENEKKEERFETFKDVQIAMKLSERRTPSLLVALTSESLATQKYFAEDKTKQDIERELKGLQNKTPCFILWQEEGTKDFYVSALSASGGASGLIEHIRADTSSVPGKVTLLGEIVSPLPPTLFEKLSYLGKPYSAVQTDLRTHELFQRLGEPLKAEDRETALQRLDLVKKALGEKAYGTYFMVKDRENTLELVFLDDKGSIRSGPLEIGSRSITFEGKEFSSFYLQSFYRLQPITPALLFKAAFTNLHFTPESERALVVVNLEKDVQTLGERAEGAYRLFSEREGDKEAFFLAYVQDQKVKLVPLTLSLDPEWCSWTNESGDKLPLLERATFKTVDECREHFQRHAKAAGHVLSAEINIEAEQEIIELRKRKLFEAASQNMKDDTAAIEAEFALFLDTLTPNQRKGAFIVLRGRHDAELIVKVATEKGLQEIKIDLGLERGKYKVEGEVYTLLQLKRQFHLEKSIKDLRALVPKST